MYSCSESAKKFILENTSVQVETHIAFMDYTEIKKKNTKNDALISNQEYFRKNTMNGLYLSSKHTIYLDKVLKTNYEACNVLYHELIHRHDPEAQSGKDNLTREFRAYYAQTLYSGELSLNPATQEAMNLKPIRFHEYAVANEKSFRFPHSRNSLMDNVAKSMGEKPSLEILNQYPSFPWEPKPEAN